MVAVLAGRGIWEGGPIGFAVVRRLSLMELALTADADHGPFGERASGGPGPVVKSRNSVIGGGAVLPG